MKTYLKNFQNFFLKAHLQKCGVKHGASSGWSFQMVPFDSSSTRGSKEAMTVGKTHPYLLIGYGKISAIWTKLFLLCDF